MTFFTYAALFLLAIRLRRAIKSSPITAKWNAPLYGIALSTIGVAFLLDDLLPNAAIEGIVIALVLLGVVEFLKREPDFKRFHVLINAHYPLIAAVILSNIVGLISIKFYKTHDDYFQAAQLAAFGWIFLRVATSKKQQSELKRISERKDELEILVAERTAEITKQRNELQETVKELQSTQAQLIQQEKLASLGELTAAIAHEIQNPLNFVNNFSEVSIEMLSELKAANIVLLYVVETEMKIV